jgi:hypothetical protein
LFWQAINGTVPLQFCWSFVSLELRCLATIEMTDEELVSTIVTDFPSPYSYDIQLQYLAVFALLPYDM